MKCYILLEDRILGLSYEECFYNKVDLVKNLYLRNQAYINRLDKENENHDFHFRVEKIIYFLRRIMSI